MVVMLMRTWSVFRLHFLHRRKVYGLNIGIVMVLPFFQENSVFRSDLKHYELVICIREEVVWIFLAGPPGIGPGTPGYLCIE